MRAALRAVLDEHRRASCSAATCSIPSARRGRSSRSSTRCSPARPATGLAGRHRAPRRSTPSARPGRALAVPAEAREAGRGALGRSRSTRRAPDDPVEVLARRIAGDDPRLARRAAARCPARRTAARSGAGDVMILVQRRGPTVRRDDPGAEARAACRSPAPTCCASAASSRSTTCSRRCASPRRRATTSSLAALLRSPLGGLDRARALRARAGRAGHALAGAARGAARALARGARAARDLLAQADFLRPFELLQRILIRHDGRRALVARLGAEAEDGIDALLDQALAYEAVEPPSLTGFLAWIDRDEVAVKRRSEEGADQVRVMTVHGAKGLEAPIVILPDTAARQEGAQPAAGRCASPTARRPGGVPADEAPAGARRRRGGAARRRCAPRTAGCSTSR